MIDHLRILGSLGAFLTRCLVVAIALSLGLQAAVVHLPALQQAFSTVSLSAGDWFLCAAVGSAVLWLRELTKFATRLRRRGDGLSKTP